MVTIPKRKNTIFLIQEGKGEVWREKGWEKYIFPGK